MKLNAIATLEIQPKRIVKGMSIKGGRTINRNISERLLVWVARIFIGIDIGVKVTFPVLSNTKRLS